MSEMRPTSFLTYLAVWVALVALTGVTVAAAGLDLGSLAVPAALGVASVKAWLVLYYFMHLRHEPWPFTLMLLVTLATLTLIIGMTFTDIGFRYFEETGTSHVF